MGIVILATKHSKFTSQCKHKTLQMLIQLINSSPIIHEMRMLGIVQKHNDKSFQINVELVTEKGEREMKYSIRGST